MISLRPLRMSDENDPHDTCQECFYNYPHPLRRVLLKEVNIQAPFMPVGVCAGALGGLLLAGCSSAMPSPNPIETKWKDALLYKDMPSMKVVNADDPAPSVPKLSYLSMLALWENMRDEKEMEKEVEKFPISSPIRKDIIEFIKNENISMKKHYSRKFGHLLFSPDFLYSLGS